MILHRCQLLRQQGSTVVSRRLANARVIQKAVRDPCLFFSTVAPKTTTRLLSKGEKDLRAKQRAEEKQRRIEAGNPSREEHAARLRDKEEIKNYNMGVTGTGIIPAHAAVSVDPRVFKQGDTIVFQSISPGKFRLTALMMAIQGTFWVNVSVLGYHQPELLSWYWGVAGGVFSTGLLTPMSYLHSSRYVCELSTTMNGTIRVSTYTLLGLPKHVEVPVTHVGFTPEEQELANAQKPKNDFWPLNVHGYKGFHLLDKKGSLFKPKLAAKILGYWPEPKPPVV